MKRNALLLGVIVLFMFFLGCSDKSNPTESENSPPIASLSVTPDTGSTATTFNFDASGCSDKEDPNSALQVHWDWENDGVWDTVYSTTKTATHHYSTQGTKTISLEVKDSGGLTNSTTIQVSVGPETGTVTDIDGNVYKTIRIGNQWWMAENLRVTHYSNGDSIPLVTYSGAWERLETGAYCYYDNDVSNIATYGMLYNSFAATDKRNIAPAGWHVPKDAEWKQLEMFLGMSQTTADSTAWRGTDEGGKMKVTGTVEEGDGLWHGPNSGATNASGFSGLPGGRRFSRKYDSIGYVASFWSSSKWSYPLSDYEIVWSRSLGHGLSKVSRDISSLKWGLSVRCVKD